MFYSCSLYPLHHHSHIMHVASSYSNMFYLENSCTFPVFLLLVCVSHELLVEYQQEIYTKLLHNNGFVMWLQFHMYTYHGLVLKLSSEKLKRESLWWSLATSTHFNLHCDWSVTSWSSFFSNYRAMTLFSVYARSGWPTHHSFPYQQWVHARIKLFILVLHAEEKALPYINRLWDMASLQAS